jgi:Zn-dependent peptidase ImmA (M78 family)
MVRSILEDEEEIHPLQFVNSMSFTDGVGSVLASIRRVLRIEITEFRSQRTPGAAFTYLRSRAESAGIFVLLIGNLGSYHSNIPAEAFRGFALADPVAPFVVINDNDAKSAWSFTLLHELAHLWLGATGLSGSSAESGTEQFSNDVASLFLVPDFELADIDLGRSATTESIAKKISDFAALRLISRSMVAYRLWRAKIIPESLWRNLTLRFREEWRATLAMEKTRDRDSGPNYYVVRRHRLGPALINFVARALSEGTLTPTKASKILGVHPRSVAPLVRGSVA